MIFSAGVPQGNNALLGLLPNGPKKEANALLAEHDQPLVQIIQEHFDHIARTAPSPSESAAARMALAQEKEDIP